jgi:hypothetical protein
MKHAPGTRTIQEEMDRVFGKCDLPRPPQPGPLPGALNHDEGCPCARCCPPRQPDGSQTFPGRND